MSYDDLGLYGRERRRPSAYEVEHGLDEPDDAGRYDELEALEAEGAHELSMFDDDDLEPELEPDDGG